MNTLSTAKHDTMEPPAAFPKDCHTSGLLKGDEQRIGSLLKPGERLLAVVATDMLRNAAFGRGCLVGTSERILSCELTNGHADLQFESPVSQVTSLLVREFHSHCRLDLLSSSSAVPLACFPRAHKEAFAEAVNRLMPVCGKPEAKPAAVPSWAPGRHGGPPGFGPGHARTCPTCGRPIPQRIGVCTECIDKRKLLSRIFDRTRPYLLPMSGALGLMLLLTSIDMIQPVLTKVLIDTVIPGKNLILFVWIIVAIVAIQITTSLFSSGRSLLISWLGEKIVHDLRTDTYRHLQTLSLDFYDQHETGWIMDRVSADTGNLQDFLGEGFQDFVRDVMTIVVIISIMLIMNWRLALVTLIPAPVIVLVTIRFMHAIHPLYHRVWRKRARMTAHLADVIPGIRVVKAFGQEHREKGRFVERSLEFMQANVNTARTYATFTPLTSFMTSLGSVMVWGIGGYFVITGKGVTLGTLIAFINYLWRFYGPVNNLSNFSRRLERAFTSAQRLFDVLDASPSVDNAPRARDLPATDGNVEFKNVTFGYDSSMPVIQEMSFAVAGGEMIGFVGPSGAGKSTSINLLCRFYDVDKGAIEIDGHDIRDVTLQSLHQQIGVVPQEPFLFHGSIAQNIAYGNAEATRLEIIRAAKAANAHDFIMRFTEGYDTLVGERGQRLSGGERQRISIARAILKNPRILILDEATSSVDTETEAAIQQALERLVRGRTTFAIAHRLSTLRQADRLIVLDKGRVVEIGSHEELLATEGGLFRRLVDIQSRTQQIVAVGG